MGDIMLFLLVNDDGIKSKRLKFAKSVLSKYGKVITVAPMKEQSGKSMSLTLDKIAYKKIEDDTYFVEGTPVDCVSFGIFGLKIEPDYVISGINKGFNIGIDTFYSGTLGAAFQAQYYGFKAAAFSGDSKGCTNYKRYFESTLEYIFDNDLFNNDYVLNVNFPKEEFQQHAEIAFTEAFFVNMRLAVDLADDFFVTKREILSKNLPLNSDVYALRNGKISISKLYLTRKRSI